MYQVQYTVPLILSNGFITSLPTECYGSNLTISLLTQNGTEKVIAIPKTYSCVTNITSGFTTTKLTATAANRFLAKLIPIIPNSCFTQLTATALQTNLTAKASQ